MQIVDVINHKVLVNVTVAIKAHDDFVPVNLKDLPHLGGIVDRDAASQRLVTDDHHRRLSRVKLRREPLSLLVANVAVITSVSFVNGRALVVSVEDDDPDAFNVFAVIVAWYAPRFSGVFSIKSMVEFVVTDRMNWVTGRFIEAVYMLLMFILRVGKISHLDEAGW